MALADLQVRKAKAGEKVSQTFGCRRPSALDYARRGRTVAARLTLWAQPEDAPAGRLPGLLQNAAMRRPGRRVRQVPLQHWDDG